MIKNYLRQTFSQQTYLSLSSIVRGFQKGLDYRYIRSALKINRLARIHEGKRCFIIGNGPSLRNTNLKLLRNEYTFGLNRIYMLFDDLGFATTYLASVNPNVLEQFGKEIERVSSTKFFPWINRNLLSFDNRTIFLDFYPAPGFSINLRERLWQGSTVTYVAMQLAYHMGFYEVILVGVDHSFSTQGDPHKLVISQGADPNHFDPNYFGKGIKWNLPDLRTSELAYQMAKFQFEHVGRKILDATIGGKLNIFKKVDYYSLFDNSGKPEKNC